MSLYYDTEKWIMITFVSVAASLTVGLLLVNFAHGQNMTQQQREALINYCYQHADRPNPLQDLIDKGFLPSGFKETCKSVKQTYDKVQTIINNNLEIQQQKQEAIFKEQQEKEIIVADGQGVRISH
jgi:hypothetical protein